MDTNLLAAIQILGEATRGYYSAADLTGPSNAAARARIMAALLGREKVPQSASGVNAMVAELYRRAGIAPDCGAIQSREFTAYCRRTMEPAATAAA